MVYNGHTISGLSYNGHYIKAAYGCSGELVFSGDTPTPTPYAGTLYYRTTNSPYIYTTGSTSITNVKRYNGGADLVNGQSYSANKYVKATYAFDGNTFPNRAFEDTSLIGITVPSGVTSIGEYAFYDLIVGRDPNMDDQQDAIEIKLPDTLLTIEKYAFQKMAVAKTSHDSDYNAGPLIIPSGVTYIDEYALDLRGDGFNGSMQVARKFVIYFTSPVPPTFDGRVFGDLANYPRVNTNATIYVPAGCGETYFNAIKGNYNYLSSQVTWSDIFTEDTTGNNLGYLQGIQSSEFSLLDYRSE